jgi:tetratricopeptide (TPR) repeat protein
MGSTKDSVFGVTRLLMDSKRPRIILAAIVLSVSLTSVSCDRHEEIAETTKQVVQTENPPMIEKADELMRANRAGEALEAYQAAWSHLRDDLNDTQRVWLLLSLANAAVRHDDYEEAFEALSALSQGYSETGLVVGNPLFHLLVGLSYHGLGENPEGQTDNFARALICGGPEIFAGEAPVHLEKIQQILEPPTESGTWTGYEGASRDLLNGATGYLRELLTEKIGTPPPYVYE